MPLQPSTKKRQLKHSRRIWVDFYQAEDELWEVEARFTDTKPFELHISSAIVPPNRPLHDFWIRVTIDPQCNVLDVITVFDEVPFEGYCANIASDYKKLVGLNLLNKFKRGVRDIMGEVNGCAHMNELLELLPYVAIQVMVFGEEEARKKACFQRPGEKPFHLNGCHALKTDGECVAQYYPMWYTGKT
ncbi:MAG: DUF2889 domain-containing protein [Burkholderiaceae bacterium]|jgi:hypothetical protein|nr:DUF2889 domain-containing protein [Burkholderiaceae bacterium]